MSKVVPYLRVERGGGVFCHSSSSSKGVALPQQRSFRTLNTAVERFLYLKISYFCLIDFFSFLFDRFLFKYERFPNLIFQRFLKQSVEIFFNLWLRHFLTKLFRDWLI